MYIRQISRKNKDGSKITYVQLAHNTRDPQKGFAVAKVLYNFGRIEELDVTELKRLVKSISRFLAPQEVIEAQAALEFNEPDIKWKKCRSFGGIYLLSGLWMRLNFAGILSKRISQKQFKTPITQAIFAMIANRCLAPSSKLAVTEWVKRTVHIPGLADIDVQVLYRAMDFLLEYQEELEKEIYWTVADILNIEVDILFFDTTSTYFETDHETELKKRGYSKDKRRDLPQAIVGLAVTRDGIPVKHWVFPGNTQDMETIEHVKNDLSGWRLNRCIFVHDAGMSSENNLQYLQRGGGHYIVGRKLKSGEEEAKAALSQRGPYIRINDKLWAKEVILGDGEKRKRLVLVKNTEEEERQRRVRREIVQTIKKKIEDLNSRKSRSHNKEVCELKSHSTYGKYVKEQEDGRLKIDFKKVLSESRYDGKFLIQTSDDTLSIPDIVFGYKQLNDVEQAFRSLKTTLELRPNYHSKDDRIRCHIFLCFLALLLVRIVENKTGKSWARVRDAMNRIYYGEFIQNSNTIRLLTELTNEQKSIVKMLDIKEPSTVVDIQA
jgi:transposase